MRIADTNVWVRFFVRDNESQYAQVNAFFRQAERGAFTIVLVPLVVAETCFVLESFYQLSRPEIAQTWKGVLSQKWIEVVDREEMLFLWEEYNSGLHFVDSYLLAWAKQHNGEIMSFDKKLLQKSKE